MNIPPGFGLQRPKHFDPKNPVHMLVRLVPVPNRKSQQILQGQLRRFGKRFR